ncbi:MAG: substrate-binding domain-containing protein [Janthinobacterium lividum]
MRQTREDFTFLPYFVIFFMAFASFAHARPYIHIIGSSAIYPFAVAVAETFHLKSRGPTPVIESTGTGGGIKIFCSGVGENTPDIVLASRAMTTSERKYCKDHGVSEILEVILGFDGIVVASPDGHAPFALTRHQLYLALAEKIENQKNSNFYWSDISKKLPHQRLRLLGPSLTSGTREAFVHLIMPKESQKLRHDGIYIEASDQETVIVQKLQLELEALGIFSFSFLMLNRDKVTPLDIDQVPPTLENIISGRYPLSRPLYFYVKGAHLNRIKNLQNFTKEFISQEAAGMEGYLRPYGFVPQKEVHRAEEALKVDQFIASQAGLMQ